MEYPAKAFDGRNFVELYLPARTAIVLKEGKIRKPAKVKSAKKSEEPKAKPVRKRAAKKSEE